MKAASTYRHRWTSEAEYVVEQVYKSGRVRQVSKDQQIYLDWLTQHTPKIVPYVAPSTPAHTWADYNASASQLVREGMEAKAAYELDRDALNAGIITTDQVRVSLDDYKQLIKVRYNLAAYPSMPGATPEKGMAYIAEQRANLATIMAAGTQIINVDLPE